MSRKSAVETAVPRAGRARGTSGKIHPVVIYPFQEPADHTHLGALYELVARLDGQKDRYARPLTVLDCKTVRAQQGNARFGVFRRETVERHSEVLEAWCVDTCQMWYAGLGAAFARGGPDDIYWLIPGDFDYGSAVGREVIGKLHDLPEIIAELGQDLCIGEVANEAGDSKELIDTYGTFALLYNWFPDEAAQIRGVSSHPRSEFFAIGHSLLGEVLARRWFAYEQTLVILLQAVAGRRSISRFCVGDITDLPHGRDSLDAAIQQIERTERVLKMFWREQHHRSPGWIEKYLALEGRSDLIRRAAFAILKNLLP